MVSFLSQRGLTWVETHDEGTSVFLLFSPLSKANGHEDVGMPWKRKCDGERSRKRHTLTGWNWMCLEKQLEEFKIIVVTPWIHQ